MRYHAYYPIDVVNGPGTRSTLFVSGCEHQCRGCYNASTWNPKKGEPYTANVENQILQDLACQQIPKQGLSLSGGDPFYPSNVETILGLVKRVKQQLPSKDIWCWTGYRMNELTPYQQQLLPYLDVIVDGRFVETERDPALIWRGSRNQRIVPVAAWCSRHAIKLATPSVA